MGRNSLPFRVFWALFRGFEEGLFSPRAPRLLDWFSGPEFWRFPLMDDAGTTPPSSPGDGPGMTPPGPPTPPTPPTGETVLEMDIERELKDSYLTYAMSTIMDRALPDVRDGLKPSQRRI